MGNYDVLYQEWLEAKRQKNYKLSDSIREKFEYLHGLTIFAEGQCVVEGETVIRMDLVSWVRKYRHSESMIEAINANNGLFSSPLMSYGVSREKVLDKSI